VTFTRLNLYGEPPTVILDQNHIHRRQHERSYPGPAHGNARCERSPLVEIESRYQHRGHVNHAKPDSCKAQTKTEIPVIKSFFVNSNKTDCSILIRNKQQQRINISHALSAFAEIL